MRGIKLPQVGLELARLLTTRHKFLCFSVTLHVNMTVLDHPCVRLASSVGRASKRNSEGHGFESNVRLTLYLESKIAEMKLDTELTIKLE